MHVENCRAVSNAESLISEILNEQSPWKYETIKPHLSKFWLESVDEGQSKK